MGMQWCNQQGDMTICPMIVGPQAARKQIRISSKPCAAQRTGYGTPQNGFWKMLQLLQFETDIFELGLPTQWCGKLGGCAIFSLRFLRMSQQALSCPFVIVSLKKMPKTVQLYTCAQIHWITSHRNAFQCIAHGITTHSHKERILLFAKTDNLNDRKGFKYGSAWTQQSSQFIPVNSWFYRLDPFSCVWKWRHPTESQQIFSSCGTNCSDNFTRQKIRVYLASCSQIFAPNPRELLFDPWGDARVHAKEGTAWDPLAVRGAEDSQWQPQKARILLTRFFFQTHYVLAYFWFFSSFGCWGYEMTCIHSKSLDVSVKAWILGGAVGVAFLALFAQTGLSHFGFVGAVARFARGSSGWMGIATIIIVF